MSRKLDNWLISFLEWTKPRSESPESFLYTAGLFTLAAVIRKHVKIPKRGVLGGWECYPNIYTILVGDPGVARKSTTLDFGEHLLDQVPNTPSAPTEITQQALYSTIAESVDGAMYIAATELEELMRKTSKEMYGFLTTGADARRPLKSKTLKRGLEVIQNPCINLFACATPVWIKENMPVSVLTGGFASRTLFVLEEEPRQREIFYTDKEVDYDVIDNLEPKLLHDLNHISDIQGEFKIERDVMEEVRYWYKHDLEKEWRKAEPKMKSYFARKHVHMFKIAMLTRLAYSDDLVLERHDFEVALSYLQGIEQNMAKVFGSIGKNVYNQDIDTIREYLKLKTKAPRSELLDIFQANAEPSKLLSLLDFLVMQGHVRMSMVGSDIAYEYIRPHP